MLVLQIVNSAGSGDPTAAIGSAVKVFDSILLAIVGGLIGMVLIVWVGSKLLGSVAHMLAGIPWLSKLDWGKELHKRANSAIFKLLIEAPLIIFVAVLVGHIVQSITGFSIPLTFPNMTDLAGGR